MRVMWKKVIPFLILLFFILLSDAVLADWVPGYLQESFGSSIKMGLMMAVSSMVGLVMDLIFPQILRTSGVRRLAGGAIVGALIFLSSMLTSTWWSYGVIIVVGMAAWGIYYELDAFMTQQFVAGVAARDQRSSVWGVVGVVRNLAYFVGPLLGSYLAVYGNRVVVMTAAIVLGIAYIFLALLNLPRKEESDINFHGASIGEELKHWWILGSRVWPILLVSLMVGLVDATFWTTGTVLNDTLVEQSSLGGWFVSAYMFPSLFVGIWIAKWGIDSGKKKWAERLLLVGGMFLALLGIVESIPLMLLVVVLASACLSASWPLTDAVYTDLVTRARRGRKHIMGMSSAALSLSYMIGPIIAGGLAEWIGELESFSYLGGVVVMVATILLFVTPRKLKLPQDEIQSWQS